MNRTIEIDEKAHVVIVELANEAMDALDEHPRLHWLSQSDVVISGPDARGEYSVTICGECKAQLHEGNLTESRSKYGINVFIEMLYVLSVSDFV